MSRYRFQIGIAGSMLDDSTATIDAAVECARGLSKLHNCTVYAVDTSEGKLLLKGFAERGSWRWLRPCKHCKATGIVTQTYTGGTVQASCPKCSGCGRLPEDRIG